jgi:hypothetical protein
MTRDGTDVAESLPEGGVQRRPVRREVVHVADLPARPEAKPAGD